MSGMEFAGLVLPLLVSTGENFRKICEHIKRYRHFNEEVKCFQIELSTQRTLFHVECQILLEKLVGKANASLCLKGSRLGSGPTPE